MPHVHPPLDQNGGSNKAKKTCEGLDVDLDDLSDEEVEKRLKELFDEGQFLPFLTHFWN